MNTLIAITKALSDPNRIRALMALRGGEVCVCQIIELLGLAPSTVSKHMTILKQAGLVKSRKEERWVYYRLNDKAADERTAKGMIDLVRSMLEDDEQVRRDDRTMSAIIAEGPDALCGRQRCRITNN